MNEELSNIKSKFDKFYRDLQEKLDSWRTSYYYYKGEQWKKYSDGYEIDLLKDRRFRDGFIFHFNTKDLIADVNRLCSKLIGTIPQIFVFSAYL